MFLTCFSHVKWHISTLYMDYKNFSKSQFVRNFLSIKILEASYLITFLLSHTGIFLSKAFFFCFLPKVFFFPYRRQILLLSFTCLFIWLFPSQMHVLPSSNKKPITNIPFSTKHADFLDRKKNTKRKTKCSGREFWRERQTTTSNPFGPVDKGGAGNN